ncbi:ferrous iron transport protein B [Sulfuriferula multivorans]|uniref:Ferrous iron transport protein B n=1 Tax=Sulfuriferula multivorans TaxID=1559896 RepID=A0A401JD23_9PROT|nr:ferrous iron transport protein B [Sulfuriferula multivorans]GBL45466.1 ferrous iron transport protein B [Sulfuriferula multivorans]
MKRIALLGMPNTGKSTFFNRLTGAGARVGNWPGITVDLLAAKILLGGNMVEVVDLPGIYNLHGFSDDEQVVRHFLESQVVNGLVVILNAAQLDRQLALLLQLKALKLPMTLVLNMSDEAKQLGVKIDLAELARNLDMAVTLISAKYGQGFESARHAIEQIVQHNPAARLADTEGLSQDDRIEVELDRIVSGSVSTPITLSPGITRRLDRVLLHPWLGLPLFFITVFLLFQLVYGIGTPLQDGMNWGLEHIKTGLLQPALVHAPLPLQSFIQDGLFDGIGTVLSFLPIIVVFFMFMAIIEDSGYLARAAYLMDAVMARLGLDGRSFVMQLMGFGCNVPALMGTRVMRSRALRLLTMLVIPFSLCSARLQVFLFFTTAIFAPRAAAMVMFSLYLMSFLMAFLTALVWRGKYRSVEPLLLELPPYRFPTFKQLIAQGWQQSQHFLKGASGYIVGGVIVVWALTHYPFNVPPASPATLAGQLADFMAPLFQPLGIDRLLSVALLFGFIAKEIVIGALAVIYGAGQSNLAGIIAGKLDWVQAYSFMLFTLIYTPCLSTVAVLKQESKSWWFTVLAVAWPLGLAWLVSFIFYQSARALGW